MSDSISRVDLAYAAGFFDGEGSISILKAREGQRGPKICISASQTRPRVIKWLQELFGCGSVHHYPVETRPIGRTGKPIRPLWLWSVSGDKAVEIIILLKPFMRVKHNEVTLIMEFLSEYEMHRRVGNTHEQVVAAFKQELSDERDEPCY
ncbi:MAG: hypothetical protein ACREJ6_04310 [Candidatus Methylomirabilis sp.]